MHLNQAKYALDLLRRTKFVDAKQISTPVPSGQKLIAHDGEPHDNPEMYRSVVGAFQYLTIMRQTCHMPWTRYASLCILQRTHAGWQSRGFYHMQSVRTTTALCINLVVSNSWLTQIQNTREIHTQDIPQVGFTFIWVRTWCVGVQRSRKLCLGRVRMPSIGNLPIQPLSCLG